MSNTIAPLPSGFALQPIAEHRQRHEPEGRHEPPDETPAEAGLPDIAAAVAPESLAEASAPSPEDETVPAEMLFAAALMGNELMRQPPSPEELKLRSEHGWIPPESILRLKDKLI